MIQNWNAIDLHMHTCEGVTGDGKRDVVSNFTYKNYISSLADCNIKMAAITNHNTIDMTNYLLCRYLAKKIDINILFGVEIDTDRETGENYHFIAIFEENLEKCFQIAKTINESTNLKKEIKKTIRYSPNEIVSLIKNYNVIIIPHGDKSKGLLNHPTEEQIKDALKKVRDGFIRVFDSPSDWKLERIKNLIKNKDITEFDDDFGGVLFSDNRDWLKYKDKFRNFFMNAEPTFKGLLHSITNPVDRFSLGNLIPTKSSYISKIVIKKKTDKARINDCTINLNSGYNCIIGKSGSGKSLLNYLIVKRTKKTYENDNHYEFSNDNEIVLYNELGQVITPENINVGIGERIFDKIITASSTKDAADMYGVIGVLNKSFKPKVKFDEYVTKYTKYLRNYLKITENISKITDDIRADLNDFIATNNDLKKLENVHSFDFAIPKDIVPDYSDDSLSKVKRIYSSIRSIEKDCSFFNSPSKEKLLEKLGEFSSIYLEETKDVLMSNYQTKLKNERRGVARSALSNVNKGISSNAKRKTDIKNSLPKTISTISKSFLSLYLLKLAKVRFNLSINVSEINREGELVKNSEITYKEKIDEENINQLDIRQNAVFYTRGIQTIIPSRFYDMSNSKQAKEVIDCYSEQGLLTDANLKKVFNNTKLNVEVFFKGQNVKELNPGDIAKTYIDTYFSNELINNKNTVILYDQIENDVDKSFISGPLIEDIAKLKTRVQLIVVTHDPIVAVNADPINYIEATKNKEGMISYRNFRPESYERDELATIANCVDGSKLVIKERYEIYRGDKTYAEDEN